MPEYLSPGVYVEEVPSGKRSIEGVNTSTAGMVGITLKGPKTTPTLITSFNQFTTLFGEKKEYKDPLDALPYAVEGFFNNGGNKLYICRAAAHNATDSIGGNASDLSLIAGIEAMTDIDDISLIAAPGQTSFEVQNTLIEHCEKMGDRFAVLDSAKGASASQILQYTSAFDSKNAAFYYPWLKLIQSSESGENEITIPPSGHLLGIYARCDQTRGVWKAPANEVIHGVESLEFDISNAEQAPLNESGINCLRDFGNNGRGIRVWGARTLSSHLDWKYINVRRTILYIQKSIDLGTQWAVFEPNSEPLWAQLRMSISEFLNGLFRQGALQGQTPNESYFIKVGNEVNTESDIAEGRLNIVIGVALVRPAEFIIIQLTKSIGDRPN